MLKVPKMPEVKEILILGQQFRFLEDYLSFISLIILIQRS